jgi:hypothetical protein
MITVIDSYTGQKHDKYIFNQTQTSRVISQARMMGGLIQQCSLTTDGIKQPVHF